MGVAPPSEKPQAKVHTCLLYPTVCQDTHISVLIAIDLATGKGTDGPTAGFVGPESELGCLGLS